ncbi:MAG: hypothetical protein IKT60_00065 [Clostridia bacterium]|nr:hypothetical protein [Clostridia bacterium]
MLSKNDSPRILVLITQQKFSEKAAQMLRENGVSLLFSANAEGTAPTEMLDILGFGNTEKNILLATVSRHSAGILLRKLHKELRLGTANTGIAFTLPMSGVSNLVLQLTRAQSAGENAPERKEDAHMSESEYTMIAAIVNQGFSGEVMKAARTAGAVGGSVLHSRGIGASDEVNSWGFNLQDEKEIVIIVTEKESKLAIMQAIGENCGLKSEAKGIVVAIPVEDALGLA